MTYRRLIRLDAGGGRYLAAAERARRAIECLDEMAATKRERAYAVWGVTDIWGLPIQ